MRLTGVKALNWRNFCEIIFEMPSRLFIIGPNGCGKSNLLDLVRFLRDVSARDGGLQFAVGARGGYEKILSLFSQTQNQTWLSIQVFLEDFWGKWDYELALEAEPNGQRRLLVKAETVRHNGEILLRRPNQSDREDTERLTQTYLEQLAVNREFRPIAEFFAKTQYFHPVPQLMRDSGLVSSPRNQPYGAGFIQTINSTNPQTRDALLGKISGALNDIVPGFERLGFFVDNTGKPHLQVVHKNWTIDGTEQIESDFSDGTLRLIGLLWSLLDSPSESLLLLEEPELSLNREVIRYLPTIFASTQRNNQRQIIVTTHSTDILDDEGIAPEEILVLFAGENGAEGKLLSTLTAENEMLADELDCGIPTSEVIQGLISPHDYQHLLSISR